MDTVTWSLEDRTGDVGVVEVVNGPEAGKRFRFLEDEATIGSAESVSIRLTDRTVSRLHCRLRELAGRIEVRDLGSKNGVWLAGSRVFHAEAPPGTRLTLGACVVQLGTERSSRAALAWKGGDALHGIIGASPAMHRVFALVSRAARSSWAVLLRGESGTGKELLARAVHAESPRRDGPFVVVDGGALGPELADLELFGALRGAYTGADRDRAGAFERADRGTLFLDEIGELPPTVQTRLLRVLETGELSRLGENEVRKVDVRVVAATHRPLERMVNDGSFREDLYYRLAQVDVHVPPLRDRASDVPAIARHIADGLTTDAAVLDALERALDERRTYTWPGNVRELRSFCRRLVLLGDPNTGAPAPLLSNEPQLSTDLSYQDAKKTWTEAFERRYFARLLDETGGNISEAARRASMSRAWLNERLKDLGITR